MGRLTRVLTVALSCWASAGSAIAMEKLSDGQMGQVQAQGNFNFVLENIELSGTPGPGDAEAGSINVEGADGSSLGLKQFQFTAANIGTTASPLTTGTATADASVNSTVLGIVVPDGKNLGEREYLRIGLPEKAAWNNVDLSFQALYGNPDTAAPDDRNIAAGGTPSSQLDFGHVSLDNVALTGHLDIGAIPEGYKIRSRKVEDGSALASSRQGLLLNINLEEVSVEQMLFEPGQGDGVFSPDRDLVIRNFSLENLQMTSATIETSAQGWRIAYSDPQPFTTSLGETLQPGASGHPDTASLAYDANFPKANLTMETQMTQGQASMSRIHGVTLDHLVFNLDGQ
ncbi:hypothetical protein [Marinobacter fonticola]|uniref:hypothetical protein n=1 Tax=Marinobacter fonticola TaxID=2603215 RepID=UPI0011E617DB|nr:hypothetical protein [Marinobacter fonticola]